MIFIFIGIVVFKYILSLDIMSNVNGRMELFFNSINFSRGKKGDNSTKLRLELIVAGLQQFIRTPFFGIGLGNARLVNTYAVRFDAYSHNDYIEQLVNGGLTGTWLYYSAVVILFKEYVKKLKIINDPNYIISFVIMILYLIMNFACVSYYNDLTTYVFFILWISQIEISRNENRTELKEKNSYEVMHK